MKIFQIGFNKCGTSSLYHFFKGNGIASVHWRWWHESAHKYVALEMKRNYENDRPLLEGMENFDFYSDMESHLDGFDDDSDDYFPCVHAYINYFTELDKQYPNSKFILNRRNLIKWIKSRQSHVFGSGRTYLGSYMHHMKMTEEEVLTLWENQWNAHISNVLEYFKDRPNDLLVFNIEEDDATKIKDFFSEDLDLDVSHWKQHNQTGSLIPITITEKAKKDKKGRIILWSRDD
tara:strand:- start:70550 stop:71248 length:699 start_codon:yes stop_codon:yes gene_type:complete